MAKCLKCGAELNEGARFCRECGTKVAAPAVTAEQTAEVKNEIESTAKSLREITDKMIASYVAGMKDMEESASKIKAEAEVKASELEAKLAESAALLEAKTKEFDALNEKFSKIQIINQQLQTEKLDAQTAVSELNAKVASLEQVRSSLMAALNAQQSAAASIPAAAEQVADAAAAAVETAAEAADKVEETV